MKRWLPEGTADSLKISLHYPDMRWFINLNTRAKLACGFATVIFFFVAAMAVSLLSVPSVQHAERSVADLLQCRNDVNGQRAFLLEAVVHPSGDAQENAVKEVQEYAISASKSFAKLKESFQTHPQLAPQVTSILSLEEEYCRVRDSQIIPLIHQQKSDEARALITGNLEQIYYRLREALRDFTQTINSGAESRLAQRQWAVAFLSVGALLATFGMIAGLSKMLAEPLSRLSRVAEQIAEGDLSAQMECSDRKDEIGVLERTFQRMIDSLNEVAQRARQIGKGDLTVEVKPQSEKDLLGKAFAAMSENLRRVVKELVSAANVLAASATEIMAASSQLAASATETASAVSQTTTTIEEVKQTSQVSSQKARAVSDEAQKAADVARSGRSSVEQTIQGIEGIQRQMSTIAESIVNLSAQSQAIGEIITTVDDMAAQSKLLAVNASIEAAKAGEDGKGFGVVAQEVKSLAEQSKQATTQVRAILNDIQKATTSAVHATELGGRAVEAGVSQSTRTGESIGTLTDNITQAAHAATPIAATSQEQYVGMDQVALAMENIKTATAQTVASTRQTEVAARQLHDLGQNLKRLLDRFQV